MRVFLSLVVLLVVGAVNFGWWAGPNQPVSLAPLPGGKLTSVSFAPFRDGQSPLARVYPSLEQIDEDLRVLKDQVAGVRTYTSLEGLEAVPELARKYGLKVTMGAWIGSVKQINENEVAAVIRLANRYPDVIVRVIVGNEVLLRNDLKYDDLVAAIRRVRQAIKQPVGYADVWEYWLKFPQIADEVDFITIHLLPYWEDIPAGVDDAAAHVKWAYDRIAARFPGKPILVGETGWPTAGRTRGPAVPGLVNKARFVNSFVALAGRQGFDYNIIEAFDQNWKIRLEGTVGGHWGLYGTDRQPKFDLAGPVVEDRGWPVQFACSLGLAGLLLGAVLRGAPRQSLAGFAATAAMVQALASGLTWSAAKVAALAYYPHDQGFGWAMVAAEAVFAVSLAMIAGFGTNPPPLARRWGGRAFAGLTVIALIWTLLLLVDGRYRCFPIPHYLGPVVGLLILMTMRLMRGGGIAPAALFGVTSVAATAVESGAVPSVSRYGDAGFEPSMPTTKPASQTMGARIAGNRFASISMFGLILGAIGIVISEGISNYEAIEWAIGLLIWSAPYLVMNLGARRDAEGQRFHRTV